MSKIVIEESKLREIIDNATAQAKEASLIEDGWISVLDKLPEYDKEVFVNCKPTINFGNPSLKPYVKIARRDRTDSKGEGFKIENSPLIVYGKKEKNNYLTNITHWMPLPKPPKGEPNDK